MPVGEDAEACGKFYFAKFYTEFENSAPYKTFRCLLFWTGNETNVFFLVVKHNLRYFDPVLLFMGANIVANSKK